MFSFEFWFVTDAKLIYQAVIIKDGTVYFPPVYIKFRKQAARGLEADCKRNGSGLEEDWKWCKADINILIYKFSGILPVLASYSQGPCWCM